ncbi:MAG: hypothetical protein HQK49_02005 [Oligoflexia bacterium]|nr:hypothetical protein [Oligoflexia bacterium]
MMIQLTDIFPNKLILFDDIEITSSSNNSDLNSNLNGNLTDDQRLSLDLDSSSNSNSDFGLSKKLNLIKEKVKNNLSALFTLKGDIKGYAIAILNDQSIVLDSKTIVNDDEGMVNLFIETANIVIGNFLTNADAKLKLNSHFLSPLLFAPTTNSYFIKQSKLLSILEQNYFQECNIVFRDYHIKFKDSSCSFTVVLLIQLDVNSNILMEKMQ